MVSKVTSPLLVAVQRYQIEAPPVPKCRGSPGSTVASNELPLTVPVSPTITSALAKLSLAGWAAAGNEPRTIEQHQPTKANRRLARAASPRRAGCSSDKICLGIRAIRVIRGLL